MPLLGLLVTAAYARPADGIDNVDGEVAPIRCQYERTDDAALCGAVTACAEAAWAWQVDAHGFPPPIPDGGLGGSNVIDGYLLYRDDGPDSFGVFCDRTGDACADVDPDDGVAGASAWIEVDSRTSEAKACDAVARGLNRAITLGMDFTEPEGGFVGGTAVWAQSEGGADATPLVRFAPAGQRVPWASVVLQSQQDLYDAHGVWIDVDSGGIVFAAWFVDRYGFEMMAPWDLAVQPTTEPEPDLLDAWAQLAGGDWTDEMLVLALDRARVGSSTAPPWAMALGPESYAAREGTDIEVPADLQPAWPPYPLGASYWDVVVHAGEPVTFAVESEADAEWGLVIAGTLSHAVFGEWTTFVPPDDGVATVGVVNLGPSGFDADDPLKPAPFRLTVRPGIGDDADDPTRCACSATPAGDLGTGVLGLWWFGVRRRGRRARP